MSMPEGYYIEWNGEFWQSVFPGREYCLSQLHTTIEDAKDYFREYGIFNPTVLERIG